jgi:hypothetical protein
MMNMTKPGKFKTQIWLGSCMDCEAEFECLLEDLRGKVTYNTRAGLRDGPAFARIACPECGTNESLKFHFDRNRVSTLEKQENA